MAEQTTEERTAALRERIAEALYRWTLKAAGGRALIPPHEEDLREISRARADAVMDVLRPELEAWADMRDLRAEDTRELHRLATERDDAQRERDHLAEQVKRLERQNEQLEGVIDDLQCRLADAALDGTETSQ